MKDNRFTLITKCSPLLEPSLFIRTHWYAAQFTVMIRNFLGMCQLQPALMQLRSAISVVPLPPGGEQANSSGHEWAKDREEILQEQELISTGQEPAGQWQWAKVHGSCLWLLTKMTNLSKKKKNIKNCDTAQRVKDQKEGKGQGEIMRGQGKTASKKKNNFRGSGESYR